MRHWEPHSRARSGRAIFGYKRYRDLQDLHQTQSSKAILPLGADASSHSILEHDKPIDDYDEEDGRKREVRFGLGLLRSLQRLIEKMMISKHAQVH